MTRAVDILMGWPYPKRKSFLAELAKSQQAKYAYPLRFQRRTDVYNVYSIEVDLPKYRLANGRTQASQEEYLAKNPKCGSDFFTRDQEREDVQRVQHQLLWEMVVGSTLLTYFKDSTSNQEQPLILTGSGLVVNGNRRLCAMRELYYGDQAQYSRFSHVDVLILPHCTEKDIDELEAYLQIQPDIKEEYTWISKACMLRARQAHHSYTTDQLASIYSMSEKDIRSTLAQLDLVDEYLTSRGMEKRYDLVDKSKFAFEQLLKGRPQLRRADERDLFSQITYLFIDDPDAAGGRLYQRIPEVRQHLRDIAERLVEDFGIEPADPVGNDDYELFGVDTTEDSFESVVRVVSESEDRDVIIETIVDVIDGHKEIQRQQKQANAVLKQITEANTHLRNAINFIDESTSKQGIEQQLQAITESIETIREWLSSDA